MRKDEPPHRAWWPSYPALESRPQGDPSARYLLVITIRSDGDNTFSR